MNIFYVHRNPIIAAQSLGDKHVIKMILESAQLLSTVHRVLDGIKYTTMGKKRKVKRYTILDARENTLYEATHINHPSAVWVRQSKDNYLWLYQMWVCLLREYTYRYGKVHACARLTDVLAEIPHNLQEKPFSEPTPAMPDECKIAGDSLASYHKYYIERKIHFAKWTKRPTPNWFATAVSNNANISIS